MKRLILFGDTPTIPSIPTFRSQWKTDNPGVSANNQITIPTEAGGTYGAIVNWGDGIIETGFTTFNDPRWTHTYASPGTFNVKITGTITGFRFAGGGDRRKLLDISEWGVLRVGNNGNYFQGCNNLVGTATDPLDLTGTTTLQSMFADCFVFIGAIGNWNVSAITNLSGTFANALLFNSLIEPWDVSSVILLDATFSGASLFNQPLDNWNLSSCLSMIATFSGASSFNQPLNNWSVNLVTKFIATFQNAIAFNQSLNNWSVLAGTDFSLMFEGATAFNGLIENWPVSAAISLFGMLNNASAFDQNLGAWPVQLVTIMTSMMSGTSLSKTNYDLILVGWESLLPSLQNNVTLDVGTTQFSAGVPATARANIISTKSWTINDGGQAP